MVIPLVRDGHQAACMESRRLSVTQFSKAADLAGYGSTSSHFPGESPNLGLTDVARILHIQLPRAGARLARAGQ